ncbi:MAG: BrnT family toxin [Caldilinea sp. CFX5]|nr:BrnT family toxin [Caldilinea sp. CFX5]
MNYHFEWDPAKDRSNIRRRQISFRRASTVFRDPHQLTLYDEDHSEREERWVTFGLDSAGVLLAVVHTFTEMGVSACRIRIISARKAEPPEVAQYQERNR